MLSCWGLLQIFKFQGVPKSFQVSVAGDPPEGHVVLEGSQERVNTGIKAPCLLCILSTRLSQCPRQGAQRRAGGGSVKRKAAPHFSRDLNPASQGMEAAGCLSELGSPFCPTLLRNVLEAALGECH